MRDRLDRDARHAAAVASSARGAEMDLSDMPRPSRDTRRDRFARGPDGRRESDVGLYANPRGVTERRASGRALHHRSDPQGPWRTPSVAIDSIRRECLDHVVVVNTAGLRRTLTAYGAYYMCWRTHLGLGKDTPSLRPVTSPSAGRVVGIPEVRGLHHRYDRVAA